MKSYLLRLGTAMLLSFSLPGLSGTYLEDRDVTGSEWHTGKTGAAYLNEMSSSQWLTAHESQAADLSIGDFGFVVEHARLNQLVYQTANQLLSAWPGTAPDVALFVLGDRSPLVYGAATTRFGEIYINFGVFIHAESADELAAVVAHELSHVLLGHIEALDYKKAKQDSMEAVDEARKLYLDAEMLGTELQGQSSVSYNPEVEQMLQQSALQQIVANKLYQSAHSSLFSRRHEYEADRLALDLLIAAEYSPMGLKVSLERMAHSYELSSEISSYFTDRSQELMTEGRETLEESLGEEDATEFMQDYLTDKAGDLKDSLFDFGKKTLFKSTAQSHPVPQKRVEKITDYLYENYPRSVRRRKLDKAAASDFSKGEIAKLLRQYESASLSLQALGENRLPLAEELSLQAISSPTANAAYPRYVAFHMRRAQGDKNKAALNYSRIGATELVPVFATVEFADVLAEMGDAVELADLLKKYESRYGKIDAYYPARITAAKQLEDNAKVETLALECYEISDPDSILFRKCAANSGLAYSKDSPGSAFGSALGSAVKNLGEALSGERN